MAKFQVEISEVKEGGGCMSAIFWAVLTFVGCLLLLSMCGRR
jgi:hypothetical protein